MLLSWIRPILILRNTNTWRKDPYPDPRGVTWTWSKVWPEVEVRAPGHVSFVNHPRKRDLGVDRCPLSLPQVIISTLDLVSHTNVKTSRSLIKETFSFRKVLLGCILNHKRRRKYKKVTYNESLRDHQYQGIPGYYYVFFFYGTTTC